MMITLDHLTIFSYNIYPLICILFFLIKLIQYYNGITVFGVIVDNVEKNGFVYDNWWGRFFIRPTFMPMIVIDGNDGSGETLLMRNCMTTVPWEIGDKFYIIHTWTIFGKRYIPKRGHFRTCLFLLLLYAPLLIITYVLNI